MESLHKANDKTPVLGLFAPGNLPVLLTGPNSSLYGSVEKEPVKCAKNPLHDAKVPTLEAMTKKAIALLQGNSKGFFLQVEGASIDKTEHSANACGQLGETLDLDKAVKLALDFAKKDGNTLVVVTSDHGQAVQIIPTGVKAPGLTQAVMTADGVPMALSYATSIDPKNQEHTGTQLRIAAYGPGAANFTALTDQTDLFFTLRNVLGLKK